MYNGRKDTMRPSARNEMHVGNETGESGIMTLITGTFIMLVVGGVVIWVTYLLTNAH